MKFEDVKNGIDVAFGVVEIIYNFDQMTQSIKHSGLMRKKTALMTEETELIKQRVYEQRRKYLQERRKVATQFELATQAFKDELDRKLDKHQEVKQERNRSKLSRIKLSFKR